MGWTKGNWGLIFGRGICEDSNKKLEGDDGDQTIRALRKEEAKIYREKTSGAAVRVERNKPECEGDVIG